LTYTPKALPGSYSLSGTGTYDSRFIIQVFDSSNTNLGLIILSQPSGTSEYQLAVRSLGDLRGYFVNGWISPTNSPDQSDLLSYVDWIVNGRSMDFYYQIGAEVSSIGNIQSAYANATLNFGNSNAVPIPPSVWLLGSGLVGLVGLRRKFFRK
jgi:hypothetical protein